LIELERGIPQLQNGRKREFREQAMSDTTRVMWNGTVRALPFREQVEAARIAGCSVIAITPSDYNKWLGTGTSTSDLKRVAVTFLDHPTSQSLRSITAQEISRSGVYGHPRICHLVLGS
jgi:hypothetical protein